MEQAYLIMEQVYITMEVTQIHHQEFKSMDKALEAILILDTLLICNPVLSQMHKRGIVQIHTLAWANS